MTQWTHEMSVGNFEIDNQHKKLLNLIDRLSAYQENLSADHSKTNIEYVQEVLNEVADYASGHFEYEETLLASFFPSLLHTQRQQHHEFTEHICDLLIESIHGHTDVAAIQDYLCNWWINHVLEEDMQYKNYLLDRR